MKYFGTDGIRGKIDETLNTKTLNKVAKAIILFYKHNKLNSKLLVGNDSRITSNYILSTLCSKLLRNGIEVHNVGLCSSPCLAYLTQKYNYPLSLMFSASHNPAEYNGLKFFNSKGEKVNDNFEEEFENYMDKKVNLKNNLFCELKNVEYLKQDYINRLKSIKKFKFPVIVDGSNGGTSEIIKHVFAKHEKINVKPDGTNINLNAGCTHIEMLKSLCIKKQKIGFAVDGDGDRIAIVDKNGDVINGDKILYILSKYYQKPNDVCVGTIYSNLGLENSLKKLNITLKRSAVGDKKVYELMQQQNAILGGEESGHIILKPFMNTGDGLLVAIIVANILELSKTNFKQLLTNFKEYCQLRSNLKITNTNVTEILNNSEVKDFIEEQVKHGVKIVIRPSGTEPVIRLFVEHEKKEIAENTLNKLNKLILK